MPSRRRPQQKRERDRSQKHEKPAQGIAEAPQDPAPGSRHRLLGDGNRRARARGRKVQGARAAPGDRPGCRPARFQRLWRRLLSHARIHGQRAFALDQTARDVIGHGSDDRVDRLAFGHQQAALARVLEKSIGALVMRHVDKRDHVEEEPRMLALRQRHIEQVDALRRLVDDLLQRALKRLRDGRFRARAPRRSLRRARRSPPEPAGSRRRGPAEPERYEACRPSTRIFGRALGGKVARIRRIASLAVRLAVSAARGAIEHRVEIADKPGAADRGRPRWK